MLGKQKTVRFALEIFCGQPGSPDGGTEVTVLDEDITATARDVAAIWSARTIMIMTGVAVLSGPWSASVANIWTATWVAGKVVLSGSSPGPMRGLGELARQARSAMEARYELIDLSSDTPKAVPHE